MEKEADKILEKLKQLKKIDNATFSDTFNQRMREVYSEENASAEVVMGVELVLIWKSFDELLNQFNNILATLKGNKQRIKKCEK